MYRLRLAASRIAGSAQALPRIARLARRADHRLERVPRKPTWRRFLDLVYISLRWGEVSTLYQGQGADRAGVNVRRDYFAYKDFRRIRDSGNRSSITGDPWDYVCLLQDKLLFERYFGAGGFPVIPTVCALDTNAGVEYKGLRHDSVTALAAQHGEPLSLFCKPRFGIHGRGSFRLDIDGTGLLVDGNPMDAEALARTVHEPYLCQRVIDQHADVACLHPHSVNTLRVVTFRGDDWPKVFLVSLRVGAGGQVTDNCDAGRCVVQVDADSGRLAGTAVWRIGDSLAEVRRHPTTEVPFGDCRIPEFDRCLELARRAHAWAPGVRSVGWDIALTTEGPKLLEGNDDWSGSSPIMFVPGLRRHLLRLYGLDALPQ